jgi:hypothetical protein
MGGAVVAEERLEEATGDKKKKKGIGVNFKVSAKGAVSVYGLGRFPVTLYREQWLRLMERVDDLKKFLEDHADELKAKGDQTPTSVQDVPLGEPIVGSAAPDAQESGATGSGVTGSGATEAATTSEDAGAYTGDRGRAGGAGAEAAASADAGGGGLNPGTKAVDTTGDVAYGDDYPEKPTDPWRPGGY